MADKTAGEPSKKMGRRRLSNEERLGFLMSFAVTEGDREKITLAAQQMGISASVLIRQSVFSAIARLQSGRSI